MSDRRIAVVTGAASGLGAVFAARLAADGHNVVAADLADTGETVSKIEAEGVRGLGVRCDVADESSVAELAGSVREFGGCNVLVNNAGIYPFAMFEDLDFAEWRRILSTNLDSMFLTCHAFLPEMKAAGWGRVINIASNAYINGADPMLAAYVASKGGVIGLTRALGSEYGAYGITVNAVAPGLVVTGTTVELIGDVGEPGADKWEEMRAMQAIPRTGTPNDIAGAIAFLASDDSSYMTAQTVVVDGGLGRV